MLKSDILKQTRATKAEAAQALLDLPTPTAEQTAQAVALTAEVRALGTQIENQITIEAALRDKPAAPPAVTQPTIDNSGNRPVIQFRSPGPLKAFRGSTTSRQTSFETRQDAERAAYASGKWFQAALFGNKKAQQWCQENGVFSYGSNSERVVAMEREVFNTVHEEGTAGVGGFLVPDEFERSVIDLRDMHGVARRFCSISNMTSDYKVQPKRLTGLTATARAESVAVTETNKTWGQAALTAKSWDLLTKWSRELGEDAVISMADDLAAEAGQAFAYAEDYSLFQGDASVTYNGISGLYKIWFDQWAASESWLGGVTTPTHNLLTEIDTTDLAKVMGQTALYAKQSPRCAWFVSPEGAAVVFDRLTGAASGNNAFDLAAGRPRTYAGYPVIECLTHSAIGMATDYDEKPMVYFGDMSMAVLFGNRRGMTVQVLNELYAANGQIGLIASERFDINVHNYGTTAVKSPLVAYMGEAS